MRAVVAFLLLTSLNRADIERAVSMTWWPHTDQERARFHDRYAARFTTDPTIAPAVESIEVITEFRRIELIAEQHAALNDLWARGGAISDAEEALKPWRGRLSIVAHVRLPVIATSVPESTVAVAGPDAPRPIDRHTSPVYSGGGDTPSLTGADVESVFAPASIGDTIRTVLVVVDGRELARATFDFRALD